jgi:methyl-accepting chemotaxis protein
LFEKTTDALSQIEPVVNEMELSVKELSANSYDILTFVNDKILRDYIMFEDMCEEYCNNTDSMYSTLNELSSGTYEINNALEQITKAIELCAKTIEKTTNNTEDINVNISDINDLIVNIKYSLNDQVDSTEKLNEIISKFKL